MQNPSIRLEFALPFHTEHFGEITLASAIESHMSGVNSEPGRGEDMPVISDRCLRKDLARESQADVPFSVLQR
jgi:hypothetical protein